MDPQWIIAIASSIGAIGIIGVAYQAYIASRNLTVASAQLNNSIKQLRADHERSRREKAIEILSQWDKNLALNCAVARKFAETLTFQQSKLLFNQEPFEIDSKCYGLFLGALSPVTAELRDNTAPEKTIEVSEREAGEIRWALVTYLNQLETTLSAVRHNVADKDMIYEQFTYLVSPKDGHYVLEDFRKAAGGSDNFPSIETFAQELKMRHSHVTEGKQKIA